MARLQELPNPHQGSFGLEPEASDAYTFPPFETSQGVSVRIIDLHEGLDRIRRDIPRQEQRQGLMKVGESTRLMGGLARREGSMEKAHDRVEKARMLHNVTGSDMRRTYAEVAGYKALLESGLFEEDEIKELQTRAATAFIDGATKDYKRSRK